MKDCPVVVSLPVWHDQNGAASVTRRASSASGTCAAGVTRRPGVASISLHSGGAGGSGVTRVASIALWSHGSGACAQGEQCDEQKRSC